MPEMKMKHLEFIQGVVTRMNRNSFLLKGWTVSLLAGILAVDAAHPNQMLLFVGGIPILLFWFLDAYYLHVERAFRDLYDQVRLKSNEDIDFNMTPSLSVKTLVKAMFSLTIFLFHGSLAAAFVAIHCSFV